MHQSDRVITGSVVWRIMWVYWFLEVLAAEGSEKCNSRTSNDILGGFVEVREKHHS